MTFDFQTVSNSLEISSTPRSSLPESIDRSKIDSVEFDSVKSDFRPSPFHQEVIGSVTGNISHPGRRWGLCIADDYQGLRGRAFASLRKSPDNEFVLGERRCKKTIIMLYLVNSELQKTDNDVLCSKIRWK